MKRPAKFYAVEMLKAVGIVTLIAPATLAIAWYFAVFACHYTPNCVF